MSARVDEIIPVDPLGSEAVSVDAIPQTLPGTASSQAGNVVSNSIWDAEYFAQEQLHGLVQRVFFPGWPKPSRQVVVSSADTESDTSAVCVRILRLMATDLPGTVCALEADLHSPRLAQRLSESLTNAAESDREGSIAVGKNLWLLKPESIFSRQEDGLGAHLGSHTPGRVAA